MPKILRIINRFNLGGPTYNAAYLTKFLAPEFETLLVGGEKDESEDSSEFILQNLNIQPMIIPEMKRSLHWMDDRIAYRKIKSLITEFRPDIVHTHASKAGALGRRAAYTMKVPVIVHTFHGHVFHSYFGRFKTEIFKTIERRLAKKSDAIIAISEQQKQELAFEHKICPPEKIEVIPLGFDLSRFRENMDEKRKQFRGAHCVAQDEIAIAIVGRLVPIKNHRLFLRAFDHVRKETQRKIKAFVVGDGELKEELMNYCNELGLSFTSRPSLHPNADVFFTSWIKNVDRVMAGVDIVCLTSLNEGTPVSLIEAQAAGKPVVATKAGGTENVVGEGETGLLSAVGDEVAFSKSLLELVSNDELRRKMSENGWKRVEQRYHYSRLVSETAGLYRRLLALKKP